ncbi:hypothetical protein [Burkholderia sola]|uniref:hypothetical protein n=1 Tax=Burkholderia sola TaxID=2843302 RepID=UPI0023DD8099|nr:hypothetical protein [Burkholderia sola]
MREGVGRIGASIERFDDRSSVCMSSGDRQAIYAEWRAFGMIDARHIVDVTTLGSSPVYATTDTAAHFIFPQQHDHCRAGDDADMGSRESVGMSGAIARKRRARTTPRASRTARNGMK